MTITRSVIEDLLPLYSAGEASDDTRRLVQEYLAAHPEIARPEAMHALPPVAPPPELGMRALRQTANLLAQRQWLLAASATMTALPMSFTFNRHGVQFLLFLDAPELAAAMWAAAAIGWIRFFIVRRRLQATGL